MGKLPGVNHLHAVKAFQRAGFEIVRQSGHIILSDGQRIIVIPRDAGLTIEQFRDLL
jgi:predicted RNA binding protein YcfA (HicA-like mRNA interferase family)